MSLDPLQPRSARRPAAAFRFQIPTRSVLLILTALALVGYTLARAQTPPATPSAARPRARTGAASNTPSGQTLYAQDWDGASKTNTGVVHTFRYVSPGDNRVITGDHAAFDRSKRTLDAKGNLVFDDPKHHVTANTAFVDDGPAKLAIFRGNVVLTLKPESGSDVESSVPDDAQAPAPAPGANGVAAVTPPAALQPKPAEKNNAQTIADGKRQGGVVNCDRLDNYYRRKFVWLTGHLHFKQRIRKANGKMVERNMTAQKGLYNSKTEVLTLFAPVDGRDTDGQEWHFVSDVVIGTKAGEETFTSKGSKESSIKFLPDESDSETDSPDNGAAPPPPDEGSAPAPPKTDKPDKPS